MPADTTRLPRSIATVSLSGALPDKLEAAARAGFDGVEIFDNDLLTFDGTPHDIRRIATDLGLGIFLWQPFRDFEAMEPGRLQRNLDRAERKLDVVAALGAPMMLVCSNTQAGTLADDARAAADLHALAERAAARGLRVGYEALAWGRHVNRWRHSWRIVAKAAHPALGLILDSFHVLAAGDDLAGLDEVPADKLFFVQLADAPRLSMDVLSWSRHYRNFPGQGQLPVSGFLASVLEAGYRGPISLEVFNDEMRAAPARLNARDGLRSLILTEAEARPHVPAAALSPPAVYSGFEFIEFAVDEPAREELAGFLGTLGFAHAGRHRSKSVELYRCGGVNMILNTEPDSAAAEQFHLHGPSVCALGFRVDDAVRASARAAALLAPPWHERTGAGERELSAIRAPDGTLIFLVEAGQAGRSIYDDDFVLDAAVSASGGLIGVDHVAQALPSGRMDSYVLFYKAVFGFVPEQLWELPDPFGLIRSRAMVSADRAIRLPLNISESRETETGRFVSAYAGAGVHHIAVAAEDIVGAVTGALARGAPMLAIPPNYYDDLTARLDIDDALLGTIRRLNLLYDRDEGGEYLQAYTVSFHDRFFFELVERRGGYQQFGAANAAVRMAAQAQRRADTTLAARLALL
jgi:4-hydroxyphenylpyruvate dioxygenase